MSTDLLKIPKGATRVTPHAKFTANVPPGVQVEAYQDGADTVYALVLPVIHVAARVSDDTLVMTDAYFKERVLAPMLMHLGEYAKHKMQLK